MAYVSLKFTLPPCPEPRPAGWEGPQADSGPSAQPEMEVTVSDLLQQYLAPERLCGDNKYHCIKCAGLRDADRQLRLLTPPLHLVVSLVRFVYDRLTSTRRKIMAPVGLTQWLVVPLAGCQPAQYRLYAVIVHAGHSLDTGHYFTFCRESDGGDSHDEAGSWWRLDDASVTSVTATAALGGPRRTNETAYMLLYRLEGSKMEKAGGRSPTLDVLPDPLRADLDHDNEEHRR